jgi:metal-dependent hydrolase (beta-lactamase superfamily II)
MRSKLFKIGERAVGGIIEVKLDTDEQEVTVRALDWDTKKQISPMHCESTDDLSYLQRILWDWTDSYHTDQIVDWLKNNGFKEATKW